MASKSAKDLMGKFIAKRSISLAHSYIIRTAINDVCDVFRKNTIEIYTKCSSNLLTPVSNS